MCYVIVVSGGREALKALLVGRERDENVSGRLGGKFILRKLGWSVCPWRGEPEGTEVGRSRLMEGRWCLKVWRQHRIHVTASAWRERRKLLTPGSVDKGFEWLKRCLRTIPLEEKDEMRNPVPCGFVFIFSSFWGLFLCGHVFSFHF